MMKCGKFLPQQTYKLFQDYIVIKDINITCIIKSRKRKTRVEKRKREIYLRKSADLLFI